MQTNFKLIILTPERKFCEKTVKSIIVPSSEGMIGILPGHAPLISTLTCGNLTIKDINGTKTKMKIRDGFLEVINNVVTVLTDAVETSNNFYKESR